MKEITTYIVEKFKINKTLKNHIYNYHPKDKKELEEILYNKFKDEGKDADLTDIDTSEITDMKSLFREASKEWESLKFENIDLSYWDMSNVIDAGYMFSGCKNLKSIGNVSSWDMSNVISMEQMFYDCPNLKLDNSYIENWDVSNVKNFRSMFMHSYNVDFDLKKWNINKSAEVTNMIADCDSFSKNNIPENLPKNAY